MTPVIQGDNATFYWHGRHVPCLIGDFNEWDPQRSSPPTRAGRNLWSWSMQFPRDAYIEYAFTANGELIPDALNPRTVHNGINADNHYFYMPEAGPTPLARRRAGQPHGRLEKHILESQSDLVGGKRAVTFYQPPTNEPCPLLVVFDGPDYLRRAKLVNIIENLAAEGRCQPIAMAMVASAKQARVVEYSCNDATLRFMLNELLPKAREVLNLIDPQKAPGAFGLLGASMGGLIALYSGLRLPQIFGRVITQSGAFDMDGIIQDLVLLQDPMALQIWMDIGQFDFLLSSNRRMQALLAEKGYDLTYREYAGGHNYTSWRDDVWRALEACFPPEDDKIL